MEEAEGRILREAQTGPSRRTFLKTAGATLAALAVTAVNPIGEGVAFASSELQGMSDLDILNFALTLEHLEAVFYIQAINSGNLRGQVLNVLTSVRDHEVAHVQTLTKVISSLGGKPVARQARYNFGSMASQAAILKTSETLEGVGVGAYTGAAPLLKNKNTLLAAAASIEQVESRHYAAIRYLRGELPAPSAFGPVLTVAQVLKAAKPILG
jgi:rubrerythrin